MVVESITNGHHRRPGMTMNRRKFLSSLGILSGVAVMNSCGLLHRESPPNIVLIISDDQAWGDYGFMGHDVIQTPHLDRLATQSILYPRGYVTAPLCCPSLASIVTGLYPHQHKITSNDPPYSGEGPRFNISEWPEERKQLRREMIAHIDEVTTLPQMLQERGYVSMQTGKWWLGHYSRGGFTHGMTHGDMSRGGRHGDEGLIIGRETMQPIYDFIEKAGSSPFFLWYAPFLPHSPHNPPERILGKYRDKTDSIHIARYWAMCEWFDETCGDLLSYLDAQNLSENTMVLYVCDNGWIQQPDSGGYAPRSKRSPYEGGIRTPMMVRWSGHMTPCRDETTLASSIDLAPTILNACGLETAEGMQGINLLNREPMESRSAVYGGAYTHDAVDVHNPVENPRYAWTVDDWWKVILSSEQNEPGQSPELYNLQQDPDENRNLADEYPDRVAQLRDQILDWWPEAPV